MEKSYQSDPSDWKNPAITLDSMSHDPGDSKVQNKWGILVFRAVGSFVSQIQVSKQIEPLCSRISPHHMGFNITTCNSHLICLYRL